MREEPGLEGTGWWRGDIWGGKLIWDGLYVRR